MQHFIIKCCIFSFYTIFPLAFTFYHGKIIMEKSLSKKVKKVPTNTIYKLTSHLMYYKIAKDI